MPALQNIRRMFAVSQMGSESGRNNSVFYLEHGLRYYHKVTTMVQILSHVRDGELGDLLPDYRSRREHNLQGRVIRPLALRKPNGK